MTKDERIGQLSSEVMELREQLRLAQARAADSEDRAQNIKRQSRYAIDNWQSETARLAKDYDKERRAREAVESDRDALAARVERLNSVIFETLGAIDDGDLDKVPFDKARDVYNDTQPAALARVKAEAVREFGIEIGLFDQEYIEVSRCSLREHVQRLIDEAEVDKS